MEYNYISLPANKYAIIDNSNGNTENPPVKFESKPYLNTYNSELKYPSIGSAISLPASNFRAFSPQFNGEGNVPFTSCSRQIFKNTVYAEIPYSENPNAFRDDFSLGQQDEIYGSKNRTLNDPFPYGTRIN